MTKDTSKSGGIRNVDSVALYMVSEWRLVFDASRSDGRATAQDVADMAATYSLDNPAPAILGHTDAWPKDSKIPVGAWVDGARAEGTQLFVKYKFPEDITVPVPKPFEEMVGMSRFFKEAVNSETWKHCSIGMIKPKSGPTRLHHVAYLGAVPPAIKDLPKQNFSEAPDDLTDQFYQFNSDEEVTLVNFADNNSIMDEKLLELLREMYGLAVDASPEQILGALSAHQARAEKAKIEAAAIANQWDSKNAVGAPTDTMFNEDETKALKALIATLSKDNLAATITGVVDEKLKEFADTVAVPATPVAVAATAPIVTPVVDVTAQIQALKDKGVWLPAFDEPGTEGSTMEQIFTSISKGEVAIGDKNTLEILVSKLSALPSVGQFDDLREFSERFRPDALKPVQIQNSRVKLFEGEQIANQDLDDKIEAYCEQHKVDYETGFNAIASGR